MASIVRLGEITRVTQGLNTAIFSGNGRRGDWTVRLVRISDVQDDRLVLANLESIDIEQNAKSEKHLLQPEDVVVTARSTVLKVALVPPELSRAVADATLLVVRAHDPGLGPYLWWFLSSSSGRQQLQGRMLGSSTLLFLPARSLAEIEVPLPSMQELYRLSELIDASEHAYASATEAASLRRAGIRDAVINRLRNPAVYGGHQAWH